MKTKRKNLLLNIALDVYEEVTGKKIDCEFIYAHKRYAAFYIKKTKNKGIIVLMPRLFTQKRNTIIFSILHELAHHELKHNKKCKTKRNRKKEEEEADNLANKWIEKWNRKWKK